jgi:hypothetical protein
METDSRAERIHERRIGLTCVDNYRARGRNKNKENLPSLESDIKSLIDGHEQTDPKMQTRFAYRTHLRS